MKCAILFLFICSTFALDEEGPLRLLSIGNKQFTAAVYKEILKTNTGNLILSPFSAEAVLALTSEGTKGDTRKELIAALRLPESQEKIQKAFKELLPELKLNTSKVKLLMANRIYANKDVELENGFKKIAVDIFDSGIENVNFTKNVEAADIINQWVEKRTNEKIKKLISADQIDSDTALILVNALYLSANWLHPFHLVLTQTEKFYTTKTEAVELPTMHIVHFFNYYENNELGAKFLEMKYKTDGLSMVVALPNEKEGLTNLESNLEKVFEPQPWTRQVVDVKFPRFSINSQIKLVDVLKSMGAKKMFSPTQADLTGLSSSHKNLYVSDVIQKAFINVTETGTEAAAATISLIRTRSGKDSLPVEQTFHADHPFVYTIKYNDIILFVGKVAS